MKTSGVSERAGAARLSGRAVSLKVMGLALGAALTVAAGAAHAAPTIYFGENETPNGLVSGAPLDARNAFVAALSSYSTQGFESFTVPTYAANRPPRFNPLQIGPFTSSTITPISATLTAPGVATLDDAVSNAGSTTADRFNTTPGGANWWNSSGRLTIDFSAPVAAFGFYGTDMGDFGGEVVMELTPEGGGTPVTITLNTGINGPSGALLFAGFIDPLVSYTSVTFANTVLNDPLDNFGFDDLIVADRGQIIPSAEAPLPGTLPLIGLSMVGLLGMHRRRKQA